MQLSWERNPSTLEKMRHVPLEDGHVPLEDGHVPLEDGHVPLEDVHVPLEDGHTCIPLNEAIMCCLNCQKRWPPSEVTSTIYSRLSLILMRQNARAILARCVSPTTSCDF